MLYEELLQSSKERFDEFFKNVPIFENQFQWSDFNQKCYDLMYEQNSYETFASVKELKNSIPELKDICKKCGEFYIPARNKSIPKYDVILGKQHEISGGIKDERTGFEAISGFLEGSRTG